MRRFNFLQAAMVLTGAALLANGLYIPAKAALAQLLIKRAWAEAQDSGHPVKAWSWADTMPIARLVVPQHGKEFIVMAGASGEAMAFGPAHVSASASPGQSGHIVIGGHRDTHFRFLEHIAPGERIMLESLDGSETGYVVEDLVVVNPATVPFITEHESDLLTLVTCYPFDQVVGDSKLRLLVTARRNTGLPANTAALPHTRSFTVNRSF